MSAIQETYVLLGETDRLLGDIEAKIDSIEGKKQSLEVTLEAFKDVERLALRWLVLSRQLGLPEDMDVAVGKIVRLISALRMLQISLSLMMATNPLTAVFGVAGLIGSVFTIQDVFAGY